MKILATCLLCCVALVSHAQVFQKAGEISAATLRTGTVASIQASRIAQVANTARLQAMRPLIFTSITPQAQPQFRQTRLSPVKLQQLTQQYRQTLQEAETLRKAAFPFLYYQSHPAMSRPLSRQEKKDWLNKILPLHHRLTTLYQATEKDPALSAALDYTTYFACLIDPSLTHTLPAKDSVPAMSSIPVTDNFFLYPQEDSPLPEPVTDLENKLIVIVNDSDSLLDFFEKYYQYGVLFPAAKLYTEASVAEFLLWFQSSDLKPDIVFTDIQLGDSTGYHLAGELRRMGFEGGIIALTSYTETEKMARTLTHGGFDGMVSIAPQYLGKIPVVQRITQAAQVYYQQKAASSPAK